jgi:hypothetical protein
MVGEAGEHPTPVFPSKGEQSRPNILRMHSKFRKNQEI